MRTRSQYEKETSNKFTVKFEPSIKLLLRITKAILENNSISRTNLSQRTNINYSVLSKHLQWLEEKSLVKPIIQNAKVHVQLSNRGIQYALQLSKFMDGQVENFIDK